MMLTRTTAQVKKTVKKTVMKKVSPMHIRPSITLTCEWCTGQETSQKGGDEEGEENGES
jgi:hypothetical protein